MDNLSKRRKRKANIWITVIFAAAIFIVFNIFGDTPFLKRSVRKGDLDSIGTIGTNLCELYVREADKCEKQKIMRVLESLINSVYTNIPRMEDGCFYRIDTMWADDTYMSCPFLVRMGNITKNEKYYNEAVQQLKMYKQRLYMESENIFSHIYFPDKKRANNVPWGRGNGWIYLALIDVIEHLPQNFNGRDELIQIYSKAVCALVKYSVDEHADVTGVCRGSGCKDDPNYYAQLETIKNDDHGTGMVLRALMELSEHLEQA